MSADRALGLLRAATYNVHGCRGLDGRRDVARVAEVIADLDCDVVALQEVDGRRGRRQLETLADAVGLEAIAGPTMQTETGYFGNGILTRLEIEAVEHSALSVGGREPRGLIDARLRAADRSVRVIATHFGLNARERAVQAEVLLGRLYPPRADFLIVLGDMNDWWPWSRLLLRIAETVGAAPRLPTFPSPLPVFALDRMWVRPASALLSLQARSGWRARMASDHLPLHADIALGCEVPRGGRR